MFTLLNKFWTKVKYVFVKDAKTDTKAEELVKLVEETPVVKKVKDVTKKVVKKATKKEQTEETKKVSKPKKK